MATRKRDTRKKRDSILDAAIKAFQELGYDNASMDYIAELANASKRTVYNHFPSKETLFQEVINRFIDEAMELKQIEYSPERSIEEQLDEFAEAKIAIARNPTWLGTMKVAMGVLVSHPEIARATMNRISGMENSLAIWIKSAAKDGKLNIKDAELASEVFDSMCAGTFFWPALIEGPMEPRRANKLKKEFIETFLNKYLW